MATQVHKLFDGQAYAWIEQESSIMLKVISPHGDPVELGWEDARDLAQLLIRLADKGEASDHMSHSK